MCEHLQFQEYENTMKKIDDAAKPMAKLKKENQKLGPQELKDKLGDKLTMATAIINLTNACIDASALLRKLQTQNFDLRGRVADLSTSAMKKLTEEMRSNQSVIKEELVVVKNKMIKVEQAAAVKPAISFADVVGDNNKGLVLPMKQAMKQIEREDERKNNVVIIGLDLNPAIADVKEQEDQVKSFAYKCVTEALTENIDDMARVRNITIESKMTIMGKITSNSGKAPPVLMMMNNPEDARLVLKCSSHLSKVRNFRKVYMVPDLNKEEREQRKKLVDAFRKKIEEFPEQHWVIRRGVVTSIGKYHAARKRLDSQDKGTALDRSFAFSYE